MKAKRIRIIIADSRCLIRLGLKHLFQGNKKLVVIDEVSRSEELLEAVEQHRPDVIIFDYDKNNFNISDIATSKEISPGSNVLIISADNKKESVFKVLQSGGLSFLTKECDEEEIIGAVFATAKGEKFMCNKVIDIILEKHLVEDESCAPTNLTVRELEIVRLTAEGRTAKKVAAQLFLSTHTVYTHRKNIMKKLGVHSASEMIVYAINNGLVQATT
ncbi:MAG: response regulator transcription factor [Bacteroidetes bacterium]|nr:response regulator transcription factor [Bacteroidota bacterium]